MERRSQSERDPKLTQRRRLVAEFLSGPCAVSQTS